MQRFLSTFWCCKSWQHLKRIKNELLNKMWEFPIIIFFFFHFQIVERWWMYCERDLIGQWWKLVMGSRRAHCTVIIFPDWILLWLARHKRQHLIEFNPIRLRFQRVWRLFRSSSGALSHQFESHAGTISKQYRADSLSLGAVLAHPRHFFSRSIAQWNWQLVRSASSNSATFSHRFGDDFNLD